MIYLLPLFFRRRAAAQWTAFAAVFNLNLDLHGILLGLFFRRFPRSVAARRDCGLMKRETASTATGERDRTARPRRVGGPDSGES